MKQDTLVVITGPTAVGKTALCMDIAKKFDIPIINADSRQIYKGLDIGTATPTRQQQEDVKHYFVSTLDLTEYYNASMYEQDVLHLLPELFSTSSSHLALLSGGSMMYIDCVCNGIDDIPAIDTKTRTIFKERLITEGLEKLCEELKLLDPEYYDFVDKRNPRRVIHGLEICYQTGMPYSSFRKRNKKKRPFNIVKIALNCPREELYARINARVDEMVRTGLLEEVHQLYKFRHLNALNTVGYKELFEYIDGNISFDNAIERIKSNTRKYARKQLTWYKRDKDICWFHPQERNEIINYITDNYER